MGKSFGVMEEKKEQQCLCNVATSPHKNIPEDCMYIDKDTHQEFHIGTILCYPKILNEPKLKQNIVLVLNLRHPGNNSCIFLHYY